MSPTGGAAVRSDALVLFGVTGDLVHKKILLAYSLPQTAAGLMQKCLPPTFSARAPRPSQSRGMI